MKQLSMRAPSRAAGSVPAYGRETRHGGGARAEAERWLDTAFGRNPLPPLLVVVGLDRGHLLDVLQRRAPATRVLALEPDRAAAKAFLARRDWKDWFDSGRLTYLVDPDYTGADQAWKLFPHTADGYALLTHPRLAAAHQGSVNAAHVAKRIVFGARANAAARRRFAPRYLVNVLRNAGVIARGRDVRALEGAFAGIPAVVAAAGPSLDHAIEDVRWAHGRALLIAADTALRPLLHAGIHPQLAVGVDPGEANARHFQELPACPETWLVAEGALDPRATAPFRDRTFWFRVANHHPWPWLAELGIDAGQVDVWGSVLTAAFQLAVHAGCDPIVIVGADLAFTGGRPYCRGTTYDFDWAHVVAGGHSLEEAWQWQIAASPTARAADVHGNDTLTTPSMQSFREWLVSRAKRSGRRVINATGAGTLSGDGIELGTLRDVIGATRVMPSMESLAGQSSTNVDANAASQIERVRDALDSAAATPPLGDWTEFAGEGFDASRIRAALGEALDAFTGRDTQAPAPPVVPWTQLESAHSRAVLSTLPEEMARFSAAMRGEAPPAGHPAAMSEAERAALLLDALAVLHRIHERATTGPDVTPLRNTHWGCEVPVSRLFAWPEPLRWAVQAFEAMLGAASPDDDADGIFVPTRSDIRGSTAVRPYSAVACELLMLHWARCAVQSHGAAATTHAPRPAPAAAPSHGRLTHPLRVLLSIEGPGLRRMPPMRMALGPTAASCLLTGALRVPGDTSQVAFRCVESGAGSISAIAAVDQHHGDRERARDAPIVRPRRLARRGPYGLRIADETPQGVICIRPATGETVLVDANGRLTPDQAWPRPAQQQIPYGEGGAVAWGTAHTDGRETGGSYVMYRDRPGSDVHIEDVPVRPEVGVWWHGRMYWSCHPGHTSPWAGLVSWAPGEPVRYEHPDLTAYDLSPDGDALVLQPCEFDAEHQPTWRMLAEGWRWQPGRELVPFPLGRYGSASGQSTGSVWTATAHPDANLVHLAAAGGCEVLLTCWGALRTAWVDRSLLVGTRSNELLLFADLADYLDAFQAPARRTA